MTTQDYRTVLAPRRCHKCRDAMMPNLRYAMAPGLSFMRYCCVQCRQTVSLPETATTIAIVLIGLVCIASLQPLLIAPGIAIALLPLVMYRRNPLIARERKQPQANGSVAVVRASDVSK